MNDPDKPLEPRKTRPLIRGINIVVKVLYFLVLAYCVISWIPALQGNVVGQTLSAVINPVLAPIRSIIPSTGGIDISPIILFLGLGFIQRRIQHL